MPFASRCPEAQLAVLWLSSMQPVCRRERGGTTARGSTSRMNNGQWSVAYDDFVGRQRTLPVVVHGAEIAVAPQWKSAVIDHAAPRFTVIQATLVANTPAPGAPGRAATTAIASTVEQHYGGQPPTAVTPPAPPPCRGGTTTPIPGPAATSATRAPVSPPPFWPVLRGVRRLPITAGIPASSDRSDFHKRSAACHA